MNLLHEALRKADERIEGPQHHVKRYVPEGTVWIVPMETIWCCPLTLGCWLAPGHDGHCD
jgi:hypothetical protein